MLAYWLLFAYFAAGALLHRDNPDNARGPFPWLLLLGAVLIALMIGLRFEVGGDWGAYERMFNYAQFADLGRMLQNGDPAYQVLNWTIRRSGGAIWMVNLVCGAIFSWGLFRFARTQMDPWLAMLVAIPYLVVVVAMGYSRQAVAIGFLLAGLASLARGASLVKFAAYIFAAALFHKTAVIALLLVLLTERRNLFVNVVFVIGLLFLFYDFLLRDSIELYVKNYVTSEYGSQGAAIRVAMILLPAALFLAFRKRFAFSEKEDALWRNFSFAAVGLLALLFVLPSSTVVDRMALYILPLQLVIMARVPGTLVGNTLGRFGVVAYSLAVQFVWLNFAAHRFYWLPYKLYF